ncbi:MULTISPECIES: hypothetical protein [Thalassospira]|jgi:hypothetical protein|uniref:hypothetical protein n=1 Tax=Thalassospira TaxID=168934 RepID=UPI0012E7D0D7|nr:MULTISPECIES: hypothetical protein [Thalassospira]MCK2169146.1 hypothetical protein [Thalassospira xiamenensis]WOI11220.1 hypothetical protein R1T41_01260 [Thalassospira lucentensis]
MMRFENLSHHIGHVLVLFGAGLCATAILLGESRAAQDRKYDTGFDRQASISFATD